MGAARATTRHAALASFLLIGAGGLSTAAVTAAGSGATASLAAKTLVSTKQHITLFAQDGGRLAWMSVSARPGCRRSFTFSRCGPDGRFPCLEPVAAGDGGLYWEARVRFG
jgi:hypothetical protein